MAEEKKRDDYDIELGEKSGKSFSPPRPAEPIRYAPAPSSPLVNNPVRLFLQVMLRLTCSNGRL